MTAHIRGIRGKRGKGPDPAGVWAVSIVDPRRVGEIRPHDLLDACLDCIVGTQPERGTRYRSRVLTASSSALPDGR